MVLEFDDRHREHFGKVLGHIGMLGCRLENGEHFVGELTRAVDRREREARPVLREHHEDPVEIAKFWRGVSGTTQPSGRWMDIALVIAREMDTSLSENARLFAQLSLAIGDAGTTTWAAKYKYGFWRPRRAIHQADDGNEDTESDPDWESMAFGGSPEYPSGLAIFGSAGKTILEEHFSEETSFNLELLSGRHPDELEWIERSFDSFEEALQELIDARIYAGNHFRFTLDDSRDVGEDIGQYVLERFSPSIDPHGL